MTAVAVSRDERWALAPEESTQLAKALYEANKHFPTATVDPKWLALGNLLFVSGSIYGTRVFTMYMEAKEKAAAKKAARPNGIDARPHAPSATPPPPSETPGVHPAMATNPDGAAGQTSYRKVPHGLVDEETLAAALAAAGVRTA